MAEWRKGKSQISPVQADYDESRIRQLEKHFNRLIDEKELQAASFLMARKGKIFAHQAAGKLTHLKDSAPFMTDSVKGIASITKVATATAILMLVEDGLIWLDQPVKDFIKEFHTPMHGSITFRHLLTHTSGLPADPGYFSEPYVLNRWDMFDGDDWLTKGVLSGPLQSKPGEHWAYCSLGFMILGELVSRVSGVHYNQFLRERIFVPLGMDRSFVEVPETLWTETVQMADWSMDMLKHQADRKGPPNGGGGVFSTLEDLFRLGSLYLNRGQVDGKRFLGSKTVYEMTHNQLDNVPAFHWGKQLKSIRHGLGWGFFCDGGIVGPRTYNHQGWGCSYLFVDPDEEFIYVLFVNDAHDWNPEMVLMPTNIAFSGLM